MNEVDTNREETAPQTEHTGSRYARRGGSRYADVQAAEDKKKKRSGRRGRRKHGEAADAQQADAAQGWYLDDGPASEGDELPEEGRLIFSPEEEEAEDYAAAEPEETVVSEETETAEETGEKPGETAAAEETETAGETAPAEETSKPEETETVESGEVTPENPGKPEEPEEPAEGWLDEEETGSGEEDGQVPERLIALEEAQTAAEEETEPAGETSGEEEDPSHEAPHKPWLIRRIDTDNPLHIAALGTVAILFVVYIALAVFYGSHFYPGTVISGIDASHMTAEQAKLALQAQIDGYRLTLEERGGREETITAPEIDLRYKDDGRMEQALKDQNSVLWPFVRLIRIGVRGPAVGTTYDEDKVSEVLRELDCFDETKVTPPADAYRGDAGAFYEVVPEVTGDQLDFEMTLETVMGSLDQGETTLSLEKAECYLAPAVYADDPALCAEVEAMNALLGADVTLEMGDQSVRIDGNMIKDWLAQDEEGGWYISRDAIAAFVEDLADRTDTYGGSRQFAATTGQTISLYGGDYGWMMDREATAGELADLVLSGAVTSMEPEYIYTGMCRDANDIGGTYVEVCISLQEMWVYQDYQLMVDTPVVTGNASTGKDTPSGGVWAIDAKMRDYTLVGEGYRVPVEYWMPFNDDVGIHDLKSRYYFGGTIYLTNGSHGCVNTPTDAVREVYEIVSVGTPVIVYE